MEWHNIEKEGLPSVSGDYLVSKHFCIKEDGKVSIVEGLDFVAVDLYLSDFKKFSKEKYGEVYAWAELPDPM